MIWFEFNNHRSDVEGLILKEIPTRYYPAKRVNKVIIPNRDGYLYEEEEAFDSYILPIEIVIRDQANINSIFSWLNGEGHLTFSDFPDRYYKARVINAPIFQRMIANFGKAQIQFECMPFSNKKVEPILINENTSLTVNTLACIRPILNLTGVGNFTISINNQNLILENVTNPKIDCELGMVSENGIACNEKANGDPRKLILKSGTNLITVQGEYESLKFEYEERWI